jgi:hypothetical protein
VGGNQREMKIAFHLGLPQRVCWPRAWPPATVRSALIAVLLSSEPAGLGLPHLPAREDVSSPGLGELPG